MRKQRKTKWKGRILAAVLSFAMVATSVSLPPLTTTVHAATVTSATELTSAHAGATLSSGMYYVSSNLTLNADKSHHNGLAIADGATVYLNIPAGVTLTVYGGDGKAAENGGDALPGSMEFTMDYSKTWNPGLDLNITKRETAGKRKLHL